MEEENLNKDERNLEKEKVAFELAIRDPISDLTTDFDDDAVSSMVDDIVAGHVFVLGEVHGVKENPSILYTLIKKFGFRQIGIEWDKELQRAVDLFQTEGVVDFSAIMNSSDGRITAGYFNLLKRVKEEGLVDSVFFFDDKDSWGRRDEVMAQEIIGATADNIPTIVIAGNAHAELKDIREGDGTVHPSMVKFLEDKGKSFSVGSIVYLSGKYFNNKARDFEVVDDVKGRKPNFHKNASGVYIFELPTAHLGVVPNPTGIYIG
ncbi:MAG: hypothetical protein ABL899_03270 [Nitrospira sp.]